MTQSRTLSLVEAIANVVVGYAVAVGTQIVVFPWFGLSTTVGETMAIGAVFTIVSIGRSYGLRRLFEAIGHRTERAPPPEGRRPSWRWFWWLTWLGAWAQPGIR